MINAHDFPGPALFQGLGLIAVVIWAVWLNTRDPHSKPKEDRWQKRYEEYQAKKRAAAP